MIPSRAVRRVTATLSFGALVATGGASVGCSTDVHEMPPLFTSASVSTSTSGAGGAGGAGGAQSTGSGNDVGGGLNAISAGGGGGPPVPCGTELTGTIRDFLTAHPDFEYVIGIDKGMVSPTLGPDKKPVYAGNPNTPTTTGKANFDQWFYDVPRVNMAIPYTLSLVPLADSIYGIESDSFFPIDGQGFGNEGNQHNYHFTFELHTQFVYQGKETFGFKGDDDIWVFINGQLAIDLGGVHGPLEGTVDLDTSAAALGLEIGKTYPLDFFFAERHLTGSNFRFTTSLTFTDCGGGPT